METLAYDVYKRPLALFFFPAPPEEKTPRQAFRTLPEQEIQNISPRLRYLLRQAQVRQIYLEQMYEDVRMSERNIIRQLRFDIRTPASEMAQKVRAYLGISLDTQSKWRNDDEAFKQWRDALEDSGVFIFKEAFKDDSVSGFCLYDERFPVIYVNNSKPRTRQIFTLFHELAHLLSRTGGIDKPIEGFIQYLSGNSRQIEVRCNQFTGEFLVPSADFDQHLVGLSIETDRSIERLAHRYHVSREVILRKLLDRKYFTQAEYEQKVSEWYEQMQVSVSKEGGHGNYYLTQGVYLSRRYSELAFSSLYQNKITVEQLADYLGVKTKNVAALETSLLQRGMAA
ncbi:MAG: ImmA/IrrE family metallo-endopeptidase [Caldilinea sp.]